MKKVTLEIKLNKPIANLYRDRHVLIACLDKDGKVILGDKPEFYPEGITRLVGGGMKSEEEPVNGAIRELEEELGIRKTPEEMEELCEIEIKAEAEGKTYNLVTYVFKTTIDREKVKEGDDVSSVTELTLEELNNLAAKYEALTDDMMFHHSSGYSHSWGDYGKIYGPIHRIVYELLSK